MSESLRTTILIAAPILFFISMVVIGLCAAAGHDEDFETPGEPEFDWVWPPHTIDK